MPEPYLNTPVWDSPEDDDQQQVVAWIAKLAEECLLMADKLGDSFDQYEEHWQPDMLLAVEHIHRELFMLCNLAAKYNLMELPHEVTVSVV
jgi:hypothetical protein